MTTGLNKGKALDYLIKKNKISYQSDAFLDDHEKHVKRVWDVFSPRTDVELISLRYSYKDGK